MSGTTLYTASASWQTGSGAGSSRPGANGSSSSTRTAWWRSLKTWLRAKNKLCPGTRYLPSLRQRKDSHLAPGILKAKGRCTMKATDILMEEHEVIIRSSAP